MPRFRLLICMMSLVFLAPSAFGQNETSAAATTGEDSDGRLLLNGTWQFTLAGTASEADQIRQFYQPAFDTKRFRPIPVPSNWAMHGFEEPTYSTNSEAEGFYLHNFRLPGTLTGKRVVLHFDGVWASAEVWLNGELIGRHESGFTGFAFDVPAQLKMDSENRLAVRVRQRTREASLDTNDDWSLGGIYRDVWLEVMPRELYLDRVEATTDFDDQFRDAVLNLRALVVRRGERNSPNPNFELRAILTSPDGREAGRVNFSGGVTGPHRDNGRDIFLEMPVRAPAHWTAETPNLYGLRVELLVNGAVTHSRTDRIGFREVSTAGGVLRVNGQPVKLRGVCRHDEHPDVGRATRREHWLEDIRLMKAANINTVRTSHYPPAEGFLKLCDEMGLYVIDEVPMGYGGERLNDSSYAGTVMLRAHETVARDRNRPSVIIWSIGNEDPYTNLHLAAIRGVKGVDPTRPVLMPWRSEEELPPEVDILAPHYRTAEDYDRMAAKAKRPVITTEYTHALGPDDFGGLEERWQALTKHPAGAGGMIWLWADQGVRRPIRNRKVLDPLADLGRYRSDGRELIRHSDAGTDAIYDAQGVFGEDGIVNPDRTPQRDYWETKAVYAPVTTTLDKVTLTAGQESVAVPVRNDYDFTSLSGVRINWVLMANDREIDRGQTKIDATPHTEQSLQVPLRAVRKFESGVSYYIHFTFRRPDDSIICERSVRLIAPSLEATQGGSGPENSKGTARPRVSKQGWRTIVRAGAARYEFDSESGGLVSASLNNRPFITGSRITVWRPLTISEANAYRQAHRERPDAPDLDRYTTSVRRFAVVEEAGAIRVEAETEHRVDERNSFTAQCVYRVNSGGAVQIEYSIKTQVEIGYLPEIGFEFRVAPGLANLRWLGLGKMDAYPNKRAAAIFGVWGESLRDARGVKGGVEWARLIDAGGKGLFVTGSPYLRRGSGDTTHNSVRILSAVVGRSDKFGRPTISEHRLLTSPDRVFSGLLTLMLQ